MRFLAKWKVAENGTIKDGQVTFYKYLVGLTSTDAIVTVHVDVVPFTVPKVDLDAKANQASYNADVFYQTIDRSTKEHELHS